MAASNLPARTEGALWLLHLYGKPASGYELAKKNKEMSRHGILPEDYKKVWEILDWRVQAGLAEYSPFFFADGMTYGLEQALQRGLVYVVDSVIEDGVVEAFLKEKRRNRKARASFVRSRVRYQLSGLGYIWLTNEMRENAKAADK